MYDIADLSFLASAYRLDLTEERLRSRSNLASFFYELCEVTKPGCFIEVGCYDARFSMEVRRRYPTSKVIAFEASKYNYDRFNRRHKYENLGIDYRWQAVSDHIGEIEFHVQKSHHGRPIPKDASNNSILKRQLDGTEYDIQMVPSTTLDAIFSEVGSNLGCCLWIDAEGAVKDVLRGGMNMIQNVDMALVEVEDFVYWKKQWLSDDVARHFSDSGFQILARDFETEYQYNVIFLSEKLMKNHLVKNAYNVYISRIFSERIGIRGQSIEPNYISNIEHSAELISDEDIMKLERLVTREKRLRGLEVAREVCICRSLE